MRDGEGAMEALNRLVSGRRGEMRGGKGEKSGGGEKSKEKERRREEKTLKEGRSKEWTGGVGMVVGRKEGMKPLHDKQTI
jgi:hypothetical protein